MEKKTEKSVREEVEKNSEFSFFFFKRKKLTEFFLEIYFCTILATWVLGEHIYKNKINILSIFYLKNK